MQLLKEIDKYKNLLDKKDELADQTKSNNKEIDEAKQRISQMMIDEECPSISRNGFKYILQEQVRYSKKSEENLAEAGVEFFDVLREQGLGDIIVEQVNARTLQSTMKAYVEEHGALSEELSEVINSYEAFDIMKRKETNKAGKKKEEE